MEISDCLVRPASVVRQSQIYFFLFYDFKKTSYIFATLLMRLATTFTSFSVVKEGFDRRSTKTAHNSGCSAARLAHLVWDQRVAGSNPATPTKEKALLRC